MFVDGIYSQGRWGVSVPYVPPSPVVDISIAPGSANEGSSGISYRNVVLTLSAPMPAPGGSIDLSTIGIGANQASASDFQGGVFPSGTIAIPTSATTVTATNFIPIVGDTSVETDETFRVVASNPVNCLLGVSAVDATIVNDDASSLSYTVSVESNGWVLAVRGTWGATTGAWTNGGIDRPDREWRNGGTNQFPLTPDATPKLTLSVQDAGFDRVGGLPVANANRPRTIIATVPLRRPYPNVNQLDETDHGDGTRTIRFALSDRVYSTTTIVNASFLSGWKVGEGGGTISTVTNNSTRTVPLPISRWANETWPLVQGTVGTPNHTVRVECIVATHHPETVADSDGSRHQACAAVEYIFYDGTTSWSAFVSAPSTSTLYGDNLRCWGADINLSGSGLSAGPITVHRKIYPWIGTERATGTSNSTSDVASLSTAHDTPWQFYYDPTGATLSRRFVMIDNTSSNTDPNNSTHRAAVTLYTTLADAQAAPLANRAANCSIAQACIGTNLNQTWTGRNGWSNVARSGAYCEFILAGGQTHNIATASYGSSGARTGFGYIVVRGDPADANPRVNCVATHGSSSSFSFGNINKLKFRDCTVRLGTFNWFASATNPWVTAENVNWNSIAGQEGGGGQPYNGLPNFSAFNCDFRNANSQPTGWFMRNVTRTRANNTNATACMINVTINPVSGGEYDPGRSAVPFCGSGPNISDMMLWNCRVYAWQKNFFGPGGATNFGDNVFSARWAIINCTFELATNAAEKVFQAIGETGGSSLRDSIWEGTTIAGGRFNWHNDAPFSATSGTLAAVRVNNSPNTTITIGLEAHGRVVGDSITVAGFANSNLNRTTTVTAVLDANRFQYAAAAAVTTVTGSGDRAAMTVGGDTQGGPRVTFNSGVDSGQTRFITGHNNLQTGNVIRYCAFDRNGTKHDDFSNDGGLTQSWELLYGVGFRGNTNANRGTASASSFLHAWYGLGSEYLLDFSGSGSSPAVSYGVNWFGYVDDLSANGPGEPAGVGSGDYRAHAITSAPYKPSRLLNKGTAPAVIDRDANNNVRANTFDGGALGRLS